MCGPRSWGAPRCDPRLAQSTIERAAIARPRQTRFIAPARAGAQTLSMCANCNPARTGNRPGWPRTTPVQDSRVRGARNHRPTAAARFIDTEPAQGARAATRDGAERSIDVETPTPARGGCFSTCRLSPAAGGSGRSAPQPVRFGEGFGGTTLVPACNEHSRQATPCCTIPPCSVSHHAGACPRPEAPR